MVGIEYSSLPGRAHQRSLEVSLTVQTDNFSTSQAIVSTPEVKNIFFGSSENRSPSIARMARGIGTSVYSSPKAFPSLQSADFNVLSSLAASAEQAGGQL